MLDLNGRRAVITGGTGGIGGAIASRFLEEGAQCVLVSRSEPVDRSAEWVRADVKVDADCAEAVTRAQEVLGGIDILVNSAGRLAGTRPDGVMTADPADVLSDFDEKVLGTLRMVRAARRALAASGTGRVVNIGGEGARRAGNVSSGARNAALVHLTRTLAFELGAEGITVNVVHPGVTMTAPVMERLHSGGSGHEAVARLGQKNAIGRLVVPEEVAAMVAFLASAESGGITGEVLAVSGGSSPAVYY